MGFVNQQIVADVNAYRAVQIIEGNCEYEWRQGIKHDAAQVMELKEQDGILYNKFMEVVDVESEYIYPLLKSSDIAPYHGQKIERYVIVPQTRIGQNTSQLKQIAPKLWLYLHKHQNKLSERKSSIYRNVPPFSIFGVGDYSFQSAKVMVSGFYLPALFIPIMTQDAMPIMGDDTCYFLSFDEAWQAVWIASLLNHKVAQDFIKSLIFSDAKRPITKAILSRISLEAIYHHLPFDEIRFSAHKLCQQFGYEIDFPANPQIIEKQLFKQSLRLF